MKIKKFLVVAIVLLSVSSLSAGDNNKKKHPDRGMLEKMEAVPCGAKERGLSGLGALYGSLGITHVNSDEKLCPQYLLRTDEMEYHIRPIDGKHPVILPVGKKEKRSRSPPKHAGPGLEGTDSPSSGGEFETTASVSDRGPGF